MANIALHLGSAGLAIVLFVGAMLLAMEDNDAWRKFFVIGVYLTTWNIVHAVTRRATLRLLEHYCQSMNDPLAILATYALGFVVSSSITFLVASQLIKFVGVLT